MRRNQQVKAIAAVGVLLAALSLGLRIAEIDGADDLTFAAAFVALAIALLLNRRAPQRPL